ncbi:uncharacterized protein PFLUO_LOCUS4880 [Penicillium psychrofluorescens]|uniref:uncharacterized protein n=1 Tax=Penicillium psychrofluorescens TaxID=3158075 RepID=UPI003CCE4544
MSATKQPSTLPHGLPVIKRYVTDHDGHGKAIFTKRIADDLMFKDLQDLPFEGANGAYAKSSLGYATNEFPTTLEKGADIGVYEDSLINRPGVYNPNGTILRYLDIPPSSLSPTHRTKSLDYGILIEGAVLAKLDSGEERLLHRGDVVIQRGTNHSWKNASSTEWARMIFILMDSKENPLSN